MQFGYRKMHNLMLSSNQLKKLQRDLCEKVARNEIFDFYYCVQKFMVYNVFWVNFRNFFLQRIITHSMIPISNFGNNFLLI
jgi:hypothetical protein